MRSPAVSCAGQFRQRLALHSRCRERLIKPVRKLFVVSRTLDLNTPSVLTTVWGISSRLVQTTVVPTETVSVCGPKLKLSIFTSLLATDGWSFAVYSNLRCNDPA